MRQFTRSPSVVVELDRKILADIAVKDPAGFTGLVDQAKVALAAEKAGK